MAFARKRGCRTLIDVGIATRKVIGAWPIGMEIAHMASLVRGASSHCFMNSHTAVPPPATINNMV